MSERVVAEMRLSRGGRPCGTYDLVGVGRPVGEAETPWDAGAALVRRLAACWRACEGIGTDALERLGPGDLKTLSLAGQRETAGELLEALADAAAVLALTAEQLQVWGQELARAGAALPAAAMRRKADLLAEQAVALRDLVARAKGGA
jgi:hypothetical protein